MDEAPKSTGTPVSRLTLDQKIALSHAISARRTADALEKIVKHLNDTSKVTE